MSLIRELKSLCININPLRTKKSVSTEVSNLNKEHLDEIEMIKNEHLIEIKTVKREALLACALELERSAQAIREQAAND